MKLSVKFFLSLLVFFSLISIWLFSSSINIHNYFLGKENNTIKKIISLKPKNINDKQALVELGSNSTDDFTFFDILDDPEMKKYIGLNGSVVEESKRSNHNLKKSNLREVLSLESISKNKLDSGSTSIEKQKRPSTSGFIIQVGSFQEFTRAYSLKNKLINSGYPVFIDSSDALGDVQELHRVLVGTFLKKRDAEKAAAKIKESEKINPLLKYYKRND